MSPANLPFSPIPLDRHFAKNHLEVYFHFQLPPLCFISTIRRLSGRRHTLWRKSWMNTQ